MIEKLTKEEVETRALTLAGLEVRFEELCQDAAVSAKHFRTEKEELRALIVKLSREIEAGEVEKDGQLEIEVGSGPDNPTELELEEPDPDDDPEDDAEDDEEF